MSNFTLGSKSGGTIHNMLLPPPVHTDHQTPQWWPVWLPSSKLSSFPERHSYDQLLHCVSNVSLEYGFPKHLWVHYFFTIMLSPSPLLSLWMLVSMLNLHKGRSFTGSSLLSTSTVSCPWSAEWPSLSPSNCHCHPNPKWDHPLCLSLLFLAVQYVYLVQLPSLWRTQRLLCLNRCFGLIWGVGRM